MQLYMLHGSQQDTCYSLSLKSSMEGEANAKVSDIWCYYVHSCLRVVWEYVYAVSLLLCNSAAS